jgi:hypothetical protein
LARLAEGATEYTLGEKGIDKRTKNSTIIHSYSVAGKLNTADNTSESIFNHAQKQRMTRHSIDSLTSFFFVKTELCNWNCYKLCNEGISRGSGVLQKKIYEVIWNKEFGRYKSYGIYYGMVWRNSAKG